MTKVTPAGQEFNQHCKPVRIKSIRLNVKGHEERFRVIGGDRLPGNIALYFLRGNSHRQYGMMTSGRVYLFLDGVERFVKHEIAAALKKVDPHDLVTSPTTPKVVDLGDLLLARQFLSMEAGSYISQEEQTQRVVKFAIAHELEHRAQSDIPEPAQELAVNLSLLGQGRHPYLAAYHLMADIYKFRRLACSVAAVRIFAELTLEQDELKALHGTCPNLWEGKLTDAERITLLIIFGSRVLDRAKPRRGDPQELHRRMVREMASISLIF